MNGKLLTLTIMDMNNVRWTSPNICATAWLGIRFISVRFMTMRGTLWLISTLVPCSAGADRLKHHGDTISTITTHVIIEAVNCVAISEDGFAKDSNNYNLCASDSELQTRHNFQGQAMIHRVV